MTKRKIMLLGMLIALTFVVGSIQARDFDASVGGLNDGAAFCEQSDLPNSYALQEVNNVQTIGWPAASESVEMVSDDEEPVSSNVPVPDVVHSQDLNPSTARLCNGLPYQCDRPFNEVTFPGNHNAGSNRVLKLNCGGTDFADCSVRNQGRSITQQLQFGIRYFDIDTCVCSVTGLVTCHSNFIGDPISQLLDEFDAFLNQPENRNEVIILTFGDQNVSPEQVVNLQMLLHEQLLRWAPTQDRIYDNELMIYKPLSSEPPGEWPTLGELVASNRRIVIFVRDPIDSLMEIGVRSERDAIFDTFIGRGCTSSCAGVVSDTFNKCQEAASYSYNLDKLVLVTVTCSSGLCIKQLADLCDNHLLGSLNACRNGLGGVRVPSFITADWTQEYFGKQNIVEVTRYFNLNHLKESLTLPISNGTASYIGFESNRNGKMISSGGNFYTQWINDDDLWEWEPVESSDNLEYGQNICLKAKTTEGYLSNMGGGTLGQMANCLGNEYWRIEKYSDIEAVGQVQAGDEVCIRSIKDGSYIRAYDTTLGLQGGCQSDEKWFVYASWADSDGDFVIDEGDNCPNTPNPDQSDWNKDGIGDVCDMYPYGTFLPALRGS